jgi:hypothetical protein
MIGMPGQQMRWPPPDWQPPLGVPLHQDGRRREPSRWLVRGGIALAAVVFLAGAAAVVTGVIGDRHRRPPVPLAVGDCFDDRATGALVDRSTLRKLPCTRRHTAEVVAVDTSALTGDPLGVLVNAEAEPICTAAADRFVRDPMSLPVGTAVRWYMPSEDSWRAGDRAIVCFLSTGDEPVTRSLRQDESNLTPDQLRFLDAGRDYADVLDELHAAAADVTWQDLRALAGRIADAQARRQVALKAGPWPTLAERSVQRLLVSDGVEIDRWRQAARAPTERQLRELLATADRQRNDRYALAVRAAIGLPVHRGQPAGSPGIAI